MEMMAVVATGHKINEIFYKYIIQNYTQFEVYSISKCNFYNVYSFTRQKENSYAQDFKSLKVLEFNRSSQTIMSEFEKTTIKDVKIYFLMY